MLEELRAESFAPHLGDRFRIAEVGLELELVDVSEVGGPAPGAQRNPFSVVFHGPTDPVLPQQIYRLEHETLGALELFVVPIGPPPGGENVMRYEAVFS